MATSTVHELAAPLAVAARRMPAAVVAGGSDIVLQAAGTSAWRWESPAGGGLIRLSEAGAGSSRMQVVADAGTAVAVADALTIELYGALEAAWAPATPPSAATPIRARTKLMIAAAAVLVPLLAITGMRVLSPPKPVDVASAVEQFRQESGQATPGNETARAAAGGAAARPAAGAGRSTRQDAKAGPGGQPRSGSESAQQPAAGSAQATSRQAGTAETPQRAASADSDGGGGETQPSGAQPQRKRQASPAIPEEGVYRYQTTGYEEIDKPSSRHDYPEETAMTVRHNDCGFVVRWQPLESRWDEMTVCQDGNAMVIPTMGTYREFYGQEFANRYDCEAGYYAFRPEPGAAWTGHCGDNKSKMTLQARNLGREAMQVGNETVEAIHYVVDGRITGESDGTWRSQRWVDPETGLVLRIDAETNASSQSSVGKVNYHEEFSVKLLSRTPER